MKIMSRIKMVTVYSLLFVCTTLLTGCNISMLSLEEENKIGNENAPKFLSAQGGQVPDKIISQYVTDIGNKVLAEVPEELKKGRVWEFNVANTNILNAFALPGGKVFITRGLMSKLKNEAELAAVLGHEIGHVIEQHIGKQMTQAAVLQYGLDYATNNMESKWVSIIGGQGGKLYLLKFGRNQELEADGVGLEYMVKAGYNPMGMIGVMEVLAAGGAGGGSLEILSTHPHPESRLKQAREFIESKYAFTQNNPKYVLAPIPYQQKALAPIAKLPAPPAPAPAK